jgi:hypothetical protein
MATRIAREASVQRKSGFSRGGLSAAALAGGIAAGVAAVQLTGLGDGASPTGPPAAAVAPGETGLDAARLQHLWSSDLSLRFLPPGAGQLSEDLCRSRAQSFAAGCAASCPTAITRGKDWARLWYGDRARLGLQVGGTGRSTASCGAVLRLRMERPDELAASSVPVTVAYRLYDRRGWATGQVMGVALGDCVPRSGMEPGSAPDVAAQTASGQPDGRRECARWYDRPNPASGTGTLVMWVPAERLRRRDELRLALLLSLEARGGGSARLDVDSVTIGTSR